MEYFNLKVRTGSPAYVDAAGGVHIEGFPQLLSVKREGRLAGLARRLSGKDEAPWRLRSPAGSEHTMYGGEFTVEVPLTVDVSPITGMRNDRPVQLKFIRAPDMDGVPEVEAV